MVHVVEGVKPIQLPEPDGAPPVIKATPPPHISGKFDRAKPKTFSISDLVGRPANVDAPPSEQESGK